MRVLVIFANRQDAGARSLVDRWPPQAAVLTCEDLSVTGWRHTSEQRAGDMAVIAGRLVAREEIEGVLIRWPSVFGKELHHILAEDREYVAAEMTAFLRAWLTSLPCPVLNRPSAASLLGPAWRPEQWVRAAAELGIPVRPLRRHLTFPNQPNPPRAPEGYATVTVIGERCFGQAEPILKDHARRLAAKAGVSLLDVYFSGPGADGELLSAELIPDLDAEVKADAVWDLLRSAPWGEGVQS
jgi:hypothetical protein